MPGCRGGKTVVELMVWKYEERMKIMVEQSWNSGKIVDEIAVNKSIETVDENSAW